MTASPKGEAKENGKIYSGRVYGKRNQGWKYGYVEASIKLPKGKGTWPAFWMMGQPTFLPGMKSNAWWPICGEIDIMEVLGSDTKTAYSTIHYGEPHGEQQGTKILESGSFAESFHESCGNDADDAVVPVFVPQDDGAVVFDVALLRDFFKSAVADGGRKIAAEGVGDRFSLVGDGIFRKSGVGLEGNDRARFAKLGKRVGKLEIVGAAVGKDGLSHLVKAHRLGKPGEDIADEDADFPSGGKSARPDPGGKHFVHKKVLSREI